MDSQDNFQEVLDATLEKVPPGPQAAWAKKIALQEFQRVERSVIDSNLVEAKKVELIEAARTHLLATLEELSDTEQPHAQEQPEQQQPAALERNTTTIFEPLGEQ